MVFPRLAQKAGTFAFFELPEHMESVLSMLKSGGSVMANATSTNMSTPAITEVTSAFAQSTAVTGKVASKAAESGMLSWFTGTFSFEGAKGFGGMFTYFSSRWALATFMVVRTLDTTLQTPC